MESTRSWCFSMLNSCRWRLEAIVMESRAMNRFIGLLLLRKGHENVGISFGLATIPVFVAFVNGGDESTLVFSKGHDCRDASSFGNRIELFNRLDVELGDELEKKCIAI